MLYNSKIVIGYFTANGLPAPHEEYKFHAIRRWRFDFAWVEQKVALEVEGGVWTGGRHTRGAGFIKDMEKYNTAIIDGWSVLRCTPKTLLTSETINILTIALKMKGIK